MAELNKKAEGTSPIDTVKSILDLVRDKKTSQTTTRSGGTQTSQTMLSNEAVQAMLNQILGGNSGLANVASGEKASGIYNSSTRQMLINDLLARSTGEVAARGAPTVVSRTPETTSTDNTIRAQTSVGDIAKGFIANKLAKAAVDKAGPMVEKAGKGIWESIFGAGEAANATNAVDAGGTVIGGMSIPGEATSTGAYLDAADSGFFTRGGDSLMGSGSYASYLPALTKASEGDWNSAAASAILGFFSGGYLAPFGAQEGQRFSDNVDFLHDNIWANSTGENGIGAFLSSPFTNEFGLAKNAVQDVIGLIGDLSKYTTGAVQGLGNIVSDNFDATSSIFATSLGGDPLLTALSGSTDSGSSFSNFAHKIADPISSFFNDGSIICTELHRQGKMSKRKYLLGLKQFAKYPAFGVAAYHMYARPVVAHLRAHPNSLKSRITCWIFNKRADFTLSMSVQKAPIGAVIYATTYAICYVTGRIKFCGKEYCNG